MGQLATASVMAGALSARRTAGDALCLDAPALADAAYAMAARFHRGGKLMAFGDGGTGTDASHVAVEFMHPVIVGKPALPALALTAVNSADPSVDSAEVYTHQLLHFADEADIALGLSVDGAAPSVWRGLAQARALGLLTVALVGGDGGSVAADHVFVARHGDPGVVKEMHVTAYHLLWELVHLLLERPGVMGPRVLR